MPWLRNIARRINEVINTLRQEESGDLVEIEQPVTLHQQPQRWEAREICENEKRVRTFVVYATQAEDAQKVFDASWPKEMPKPQISSFEKGKPLVAKHFDGRAAPGA